MSRLLLLFTLCLTAFPARAQSQAVDSARTVWLANHLLVLDDISVGDNSVTDGFLRAVGDARVVAFGEPTHGDGAAFALRNMLTRALHEQSNFGVLALEATGLYEIPLWPSTVAEATLAVDSSVSSWVWRSSAEARPGLLYAASTAADEHPLRLAGIDVQHRKKNAATLLDTVEATLARLGALDDHWSSVRQTLTGSFAFPPAPADSTTRAETTEAVDTYIHVLGNTPTAALLKTALANAQVWWQRNMNPRDRQMGENVVNLARRTGEHIVLWAATSHAIRKLPAVDNLDPEWAYDGNVSMGDGIAQAFDDGYYIIAFTACGGSYGAEALDLPVEQIEPPESGSLEALVCAVPFEEAAFVDLRGFSRTEAGAWLSTPLIARPLGYSPMGASWPVVLDGLIVVREMTPSTPLP